MPFKQMLAEGHAFDPKAVAVLIEAFGDVVAELELRTYADRVRAAKVVIRLASDEPTTDAEKLRDQTVRFLRSETRRRRPF
jgi:hypothetical protein